MTEIRVDRAVEVILDRGENRRVRWAVGSGFLVGGRQVLTAAHNIEPGRLLIRQMDGVELEASPVPSPWALDMALLEITTESFDTDLKPIRFALANREFGQVLTPCWAVGFPMFKEKSRREGESPLRDSVQLLGEIATGSNRVSNRLEFIVKNSPRPILSHSDRSEWQGISGAVVFFDHPQLGAVAVGVIVEHHLPEGESSLTVEPFTAGPGGTDDTLPPAPTSREAGGDQSLMTLIPLGSRREVDLQHDADLLRSHLIVFMRPAFQTPCAAELFLAELREAIDNTLAALNTGSLYSRRDERGGTNLLRQFQDVSHYRLPEFRATFRSVIAGLVQVKRQVLEFEQYFRSVNPGYSHHENFYAMLEGFIYDPGRNFWSEESRGDTPRPSPEVVARLIERMQAIDDLRNEILSSMNSLLHMTGDKELPLIEPSSPDDFPHLLSGVS
jgi:trypsin-like peptidase